jgi:phenylpyruvate tautomerase PptA (4-oxalocrotonate tautomerase family)
MPLVRIDFVKGRPEGFGKMAGEIVYEAMRATISVPENDKFQVITEHPPGGINHADSYLGAAYSEGLVLIQITLNTGRTVELKKGLYKRIADDLHAMLGVRREDVVISLVEVTKENWSFGNGAAQYAS